MTDGLTDQQHADRKTDHIDLAKNSRLTPHELDDRFYYEPMLSGHPRQADISTTFMDRRFGYPVWISSMTGGTDKARMINERLAKLCARYELGMGLGSCRQLLDSNERLADFAMRSTIGDRPLYANLGIAQLEQVIERDQLSKVIELIKRLETDGLIIHVNPLQEWTQLEGDRFAHAPIVTIQRVLDALDTSVMVKEVGQGMGPRSLKALMRLPLDAIEFAAAGGTNFSKLELMRSSEDEQYKLPFVQVGHTVDEMVDFVNEASADADVRCRQFILSGGVQSALHGYQLISRCMGDAIYGQASSFLKTAMISYETLERHFTNEMENLAMAKAYLDVK